MVDQKCATPKFLKWFISLMPADGRESLKHMAFKVVRGDPAWLGMTDGNTRRAQAHCQVPMPGSMTFPHQCRHIWSNGLGTVACTCCTGGLSLSLRLWQSQTVAHRPQRWEVEEAGLSQESHSRLRVPTSGHETWGGWHGGYPEGVG